MSKNYFAPGDWNACCDRCGRKFKASQLRLTWDGYMVCERDWEPRHPQDFVRGVPEKIGVPWTRVCNETFISVTPAFPVDIEFSGVIPDIEGTVGEYFYLDLTAYFLRSAGVGTFSIVAASCGGLPEGLYLNSVTGIIFGTFEEASSGCTIQFGCTLGGGGGGGGVVESNTVSCTVINVAPPPPPPPPAPPAFSPDALFYFDSLEDWTGPEIPGSGTLAVGTDLAQYDWSAIPSGINLPTNPELPRVDYGMITTSGGGPLKRADFQIPGSVYSFRMTLLSLAGWNLGATVDLLFAGAGVSITYLGRDNDSADVPFPYGAPTASTIPRGWRIYAAITSGGPTSADSVVRSVYIEGAPDAFLVDNFELFGFPPDSSRTLIFTPGFLPAGVTYVLSGGSVVPYSGAAPLGYPPFTEDYTVQLLNVGDWLVINSTAGFYVAQFFLHNTGGSYSVEFRDLVSLPNGTLQGSAVTLDNLNLGSQQVYVRPGYASKAYCIKITKTSSTGFPLWIDDVRFDD